VSVPKRTGAMYSKDGSHGSLGHLKENIHRRKGMDAKSKSLFIKLMSMTTSSHDGEALVAIRKANAILAEANVNWEEFLAALDQSKSSYMTPPSKRPQAKRDPTEFHDVDAKHHDSTTIDIMFEKAFDRTPSGSSFYEFLQSVHDYYVQRGYHTDKQYQAIRRAAR